jgi:hypothetical protein
LSSLSADLCFELVGLLGVEGILCIGNFTHKLLSRGQRSLHIKCTISRPLRLGSFDRWSQSLMLTCGAKEIGMTKPPAGTTLAKRKYHDLPAIFTVIITVETIDTYTPELLLILISSTSECHVWRNNSVSTCRRCTSEYS